MFHLFKNPGLKKIIAQEAIPFVTAMLIAESFFKFGSFVLECCSFLITWYLISWVADAIISPKRKQES